MKRGSLAWILGRQWAVFTVGVAVLFSTAALFLLFVLEDSFIDRRLREVARQHAAAETALPEGFRRYASDAVPDALRPRVEGLAIGNIREFRLSDGRYLHVLMAETGHGSAQLWVHDVTRQLTVGSGLKLLAPGLLAALALLVLLAWLLARRFIGQLAQRTRALVALAANADSAHALRQQAESEPVAELAELAGRIADAWQRHADALRGEQQTLAYLAHEMRTPLQSARTTLAQLEEGCVRAELLARLRRAVDRLVRATDGVLWLTSSADPRSHSTALPELLQGLVESLQPLALARHQQVRLLIDSDQPWPGPASALSSVLGNLLLNAIQHGGAGDIVVQADTLSIEIRNPVATGTGVGTEGFGIGLQLVQRLCRRCGWLLRRGRDGGIECTELLADGGVGTGVAATARSGGTT